MNPDSNQPAYGNPPAGTDPQEQQKVREELKDTIQQSSEVIAEIHSAMQIFPILVTLDRAKLVVSKQYWFRTTPLLSLPIEDVLNVTCHIGPLIGTIQIDERIISKEEGHQYTPFWKKDLLEFADIAQGYVIARNHKEIDTAPLSTSELRVMLRKIGHDPNVTT